MWRLHSSTTTTHTGYYSYNNGRPKLLPPQLQSAQVRKHSDPMGLQHVPLRTALVYLRMQVLQAEALPAMHQQGLRRGEEKESVDSFFLCDLGLRPENEIWGCMRVCLVCEFSTLFFSFFFFFFLVDLHLPVIFILFIRRIASRSNLIFFCFVFGLPRQDEF